MRESSLRPKDKYGPRSKGIGVRALAWIYDFEFCPAVAGSRMRGKICPYYAPNPLRGDARSKGLRGSGVKEEGWKVRGGRWKRGLKGGAEGLD